MSPREGINLLCTNRGLISPMRVCVRVCVRAGGAATGLLVQLQGRVVSPLRACVREGGVTSGIFTCKLFTGLRACVREGGVA